MHGLGWSPFRRSAKDIAIALKFPLNLNRRVHHHFGRDIKYSWNLSSNPMQGYDEAFAIRISDGEPTTHGIRISMKISTHITLTYQGN